MIGFLKKLIVETVNVVFAVLVAVLIFIALRHYVVQPFQVEGTSMNTTLDNGQQMLMFKQTNVDRFDIVVFPDPRGSNNSYVKRVIGLPGDVLSFQDDKLILNGQIVDEPYLEPLKSETVESYTNDFTLWETLGIEAIPSGYYFVMGDNRPFSGDSRQFGLVPMESVIGEANFIYFPFADFGTLPSYQLQEDGTLTVE